MKSESFQNILSITLFCSLALILSLPLLSMAPLFSPPDWGKATSFRILFSIASLAFLFRILLFPQTVTIIKAKKRPLILSLLALLLGAGLISTIFSSNTSLSFWGDPGRGGGFLNYILLAFLGVGAFLFFQEQQWKRVWLYSLGIAFLVGLVAILQGLPFFEGTWFYTTAERPVGTVGGSIFLGIYLLFFTFITLTFGFQSKERNKRILFFALAAFFILIIGLTLSRAAYAGLGIGIIWFALFFPLKTKGVKYIRLAGLSVLLMGIAVIAYINTANSLPQTIQESSFFSQLASRLTIENIIENERFKNWSTSWQALSDRPLVGYGMEQYSVGFDRYFEPDRYSKIEPWWDRSHNIIFDTWSSFGLIGLLAFLILLVAAFWKLQQLKRSGESTLWAHALQSILLSYFVANLFAFDTFSSLFIFFLILGYILYLTEANERVKINKVIPTLMQKKKKLTLGLATIVVSWFVWSAGFQPLLLNAQIVEATAKAATRTETLCSQAIQDMQNIPSKIDNSSLHSYAYLQYTNILRTCQGKIPEEERLHVLETMPSIFQKATELRPTDTRAWINVGRIARLFAQNAQGDNTDYITVADNAFRQASTLSPNRPNIWSEWSKVSILQQNLLEAEQRALRCKALDSTSIDCDIALWNVYAVSEAYTKLVPVLERLIQHAPKNFQYHASLATTYKELGEYEKARAEAIKVSELNPELEEQINEFLQTLPQ